MKQIKQNNCQNLRSLFDAFSKISLVFSDFVLLGISTELFWQVHVFDWQQAEIHIAVERFCADRFLSLKSSIGNSPTGTSIQRPFIFPEMLGDILKKRGCFKASVFPAAFLTMFEINGISDICLVSLDLAIVQQNRAPYDFILYGIIRSSQFLAIPYIDRLSLLNRTSMICRSSLVRC